MIRSAFRQFALLGLVAGVLLPASARAQDVEWEETTPYYEDDAWYDVSEWFDGNDYNPTDEVAGRIDDETYDREEDTGSDQDNDWYYGYDQRNDSDNWFYDYYDTGDSYFSDNDRDGTYDFAYWYLDYDDDGAYDAYLSMTDTDGDGRYEVNRLYTFGDSQQQQSQTNRQRQRSAQQQAARTVASTKANKVQGQVAKTKKVSVGDTKHMVAIVNNQDGKQVTVDLGPVNKVRDLNLSEGDQLTARGPMAKIGEKPVLLAQSISSGETSKQVNRQTRQFQGEIAGMRKAKARGQQHQMAILSGSDRGKLLVDLGPADRFDADLDEGDKITVHGLPIQVGDKQVVMARSIEHGNQRVEIDRREGGQSAQTASRPDRGEQSEQRTAKREQN